MLERVGLPTNLELSNSGGAVHIRIFLLDDHEIVRRGLRNCSRRRKTSRLSGKGLTPRRRWPGSRRPDQMWPYWMCALPGSGIEVCRDLWAAMPALRCLMLTSVADDDALFSAVLAGASGYLLKQIHGPEPVTAVRHVAEGQSLIDPALMAGVLDRLRGNRRTSGWPSCPPGATHPDLIAEGKTNRQIGEEMFLAETVKNYVSNLLQKMGFSRRTEAAVYAARSRSGQKPQS